MGKRTIIINGSPRPNGNTAYLIDVLRGHLEGEIIEISAFRSGIAPCVDCRGCWETAKCVVQDGMQVIYDDDFDNIVIASPLRHSAWFGAEPDEPSAALARRHVFPEKAITAQAQKVRCDPDSRRKGERGACTAPSERLFPDVFCEE